MAHCLALDIGMQRTGVAYADTDSAIPLPQETVQHSSPEELADQVSPILQEKSIDTLVIGLPLLPSGEEGSQARVVREYSEKLVLEPTVSIVFIDERYTTPRDSESDPDSAAACQILQIYLDREML